MTSATNAPAITIRDIDLSTELSDVETLQREAWGVDDRDLVAPTMFVATMAVGAVLVGAYDGSSMVGFVYGFVGYEHGEVVHHSHMLAVRPSYRNFNLGYRLKLAQRERVLAQGIKRMTWTFDPLQSLNAHFNFRKLGVVADDYKINFYGQATSSFLHQGGTDRLWVSWLLDSERVCERLQSKEETRAPAFCARERIACLVRVGEDNSPVSFQLSQSPRPQFLSIEIPADINGLQQENPELPASWRQATRSAFTEAISLGYIVEDFLGPSNDQPSVGSYLLSHSGDIGYAT